MTESEARSKIKYRIEVAREIAGNGVDGKAFEDLEIAIQALKEIREYREIGTVEEFKALKEKEERFDRNIKMFNEIGLEIRSNAIDEFAEQLKERLKGMQMVELQGEDVCPCSETGEDCPYMNQDVGCQYCAREQTIKDIAEIVEKLKGGATDEC